MTSSLEQSSDVTPIVSSGVDLVDDTVRRINQMHDQAGLALAIAVGRLVVERFFAGDMDRVRSRDPSKDMSLRKLANHPDLRVSATQLYRCIAVSELCARLGVSPGEHRLGVSHLREVLGLPSPVQRQLIDAAIQHGWSRRQIAAEVREYRRGSADGRGRPALPPLVKAIHAWEKYVDESNPDYTPPISDSVLSRVDESERERLLRTVRAMKARCEEIERTLADDE